MEMFEFCLEIIRRESVRFNVGIQPSVVSEITAALANDINYDKAFNRCAYMYRCAAINLTFASECFSQFIMQYDKVDSLFRVWNQSSDLTFCSFSTGPGLDYISFLLSYYRYKPTNPSSLFKQINLVSKHGAWRNTVTILQQTISDSWFKPLSGINLGDFTVIQGHPLENFNDKTKASVQNSDVITMNKCTKFQDTADPRMNFIALMKFFEVMKPGGILFFIDTKPVTNVFLEVLSKFHGKYLVQPDYHTTRMDFDCPDNYKSLFGRAPTASARGVFFVWQKFANIEKLHDKLLATREPATVLFNTTPTASESNSFTSQETVNHLFIPENSISSVKNWSLNKDSKYSNDISKYVKTIKHDAVNDLCELSDKNYESCSSSQSIRESFTSTSSKENDSGVYSTFISPTELVLEKSFSNLSVSKSNSLIDLEICKSTTVAKRSYSVNNIYTQSSTPLQSETSISNEKFSLTTGNVKDDFIHRQAATEVPFNVNDDIPSPSVIVDTGCENNFSSQLQAKLVSLSYNSIDKGHLEETVKQNQTVKTPSKNSLNSVPVMNKTQANGEPAIVRGSVASPKVPNVNDAEKIALLTKRVQNLTQIISDVLQADDEDDPRASGQNKNSSANSCCTNCMRSFCAHRNCCLADSANSPLLCMCCKKRYVVNCHHQSICLPPISSCCASQSSCGNVKCCDFPHCDQTILKTETNSLQVPNLVIPLNSLSKELVMQIVSCVSKS